MIKLLQTLNGAATVVQREFMATDSEAISYGEGLTLTSGRLTACAATAAPGYIALKGCDAGTDQEIEYLKVDKDNMIFEIDVTGTAGVAALVAGTAVVSLKAGALLLNSDALTGGKCLILNSDANRDTATIMFI